MKNVILHIGTGKTGTSTIQDYLYRNRQCLARKHDLDYASMGLRRTNHFGEVITAHYGVAEWIVRQDEETLLKLRKSIENSLCSTVLFSCETFYHIFVGQALKTLQQVLQGFHVTVICYVRRQDLYMESAYRQQVKVGEFKMPFPQFLNIHTDPAKLEKVHANYYRILRPWEEMFGRDALLIRPFDKKSLRKGDLLEDFLHLCGLHGALQSCKNLPRVHNIALPRELIKVIRYFNAAGTIEPHQQQSFVADLMSKVEFADAPMLAYADRKRIIANYSEANNKLFQRYIGTQKSFDESDLDSRKNDSVPEIDIDRLLARLVIEAWHEKNPHKHAAMNYLRRGRILADCIQNSWAENGRQSLSDLYLMIRLAFSRNFVPGYYIQKYPDVLHSEINPLRHYIEYGFHEQRLPSPAIAKETLRQISSLHDLLKVKGKHK
jgi:hypothetical protein